MSSGGTGPFEPVEQVRVGPRTEVWLARRFDDEDSEPRVVLKIARTPEDRASVRREAEWLRQVGEHPRLVGLLDAADDGSWLATERIRGARIDHWASIQDFSALCRAAVQLVDALKHLHDHGIIHGDLAPSNVLVDRDGEVHLLDLGVSTALDAAEPPAPGTFRGTLGYCAPELLRGQPPQARSDLYGLGALLYTCLTQRPPYVTSDPAALTYIPLVSLPPPPSTFRPEIPGELQQLVLSLLTRDPARRPASLTEVREKLEQAATSRPATPVLGMSEEREALRRAVIGAADGEPRVVVMYGPPGSGRRTLLAETVEAARREGLPYLRGGDPRNALNTLRQDLSAVLVVRASAGAVKLAQIVLKEGRRCLLLLLADRPIPALSQRGAIQLTPSPLDLQDATRLARLWGADLSQVEGWWRESLGLPVALLGRIRAWRREASGDALDPSTLPPPSRRIYEVLLERRRAPIPSLAEELGMREHALLDHCEILFAERLIGPAQGGIALELLEAR